MKEAGREANRGTRGRSSVRMMSDARDSVERHVRWNIHCDRCSVDVRHGIRPVRHGLNTYWWPMWCCDDVGSLHSNIYMHMVTWRGAYVGRYAVSDRAHVSQRIELWVGTQGICRQISPLVQPKLHSLPGLVATMPTHNPVSAARSSMRVRSAVI